MTEIDYNASLGDFTIETIMKREPDKPDTVDELRAVGLSRREDIDLFDFTNLVPTDGKWHTLEITRKGSVMRNFVHSTETVDDVLFVSTVEYDDDSKMVRKTLVRADLVKA